MKIYPHDNFEIQSPMSTEEILAVLDTEIDQKWFRWRSSGKRFTGVYSISGFKIMRVIWYRNSFLPVIEGTFNPSTSGTLIKVTMRLHRFAAAFMLIWFAGVFTGLLGFLIGAMANRPFEPLPGALITLRNASFRYHPCFRFLLVRSQKRQISYH
jgi:hypothetical protein